MSLLKWLTQHALLAIGGAAAIGAGVTGAVYWATRPEPLPFEQVGEVKPLEPLPVVQLPPPPGPDAPLAELASWIRPHEDEYRWLRIPWQKSILKAQEIARKTNRLIFLWGTNQPVGRC